VGTIAKRRWVWLLVLVLAIGIGLRFVGLDRKVYWLDETYTSLRISGHTTAEVVQDLFDGRVLTVADLQKYQRLDPQTTWQDTVRSLAIDSPQHPPLYFLLVRQWAVWFGDSVAAIRSLSAILSLLVFPAAYWLCWELFGTAQSGWIAIALLSVSPLHLLYAQEARQYSLWTVTILLATAALLRALRTQTRRDWVMYAVTIALLLYTFLFSIFVVVGHAGYVGCRYGWKLRRTTIAYLIATGIGVLAFVPWLVVVLTSQAQIQDSTTWINRQVSLSFLIHRWMIHISNLIFDWNLGYKYLTVPSLVGFAIVLIALWTTFRKAPKSVWLIILWLILPISVALVLPDLIVGGRRSTIARYLFPAYLGMQLAIIYWITWLLNSSKRRDRVSGKLVVVGLVVGGVFSCLAIAPAQFWWHKSPSTHQPYLQMAQLVNQTPRSILISDDSREINNSFANRILTFGYFLDPATRLQLVQQPQIPIVPPEFTTVFVFSPTQKWVNTLAAKHNAVPRLVYRQEAFWLWQFQAALPQRKE
jgi:uncharacterized membrane protein